MSYKPKDHNLPKNCKICGELKNPDKFYSVRRSPDRSHLGPGKEVNCIPCRNKRVSDRKKEKGEEWHKIENERKRKWAMVNPERQDYNLTNSRLKRTFGITYEDYEQLFENQNGLCAICFKPSKKRLAVYHCHNSGKIRGLLCFHCNSSLGKMQDSIELLENAISYLKKSRE